jgi:hypothetical protein
MISLEEAKQFASKDTSPGYPHSLRFGNKRDWFDQNDDELFHKFWDDLSQEYREMRPIWTCSQKRELRAVEKLQQGKIRTFTGSSLEHNIIMNLFCFDFNYRFYASNNKTWSFVGGTKFLGGWDRLYHRLNRGGLLPNAFELDESNYDASLFQLAMFGQRDIRWNMLADEYKTLDNYVRFWNLYDDVVDSVVVLENGELVWKHTGNPSGCANTIVDNTMILYRLFAYAWLVLAHEAGIETSYEHFEQNVSAALNGDDNTFCVSDLCVKWFDARGIARIWSEIGVKTNVPDEHWEPRKLSECQFLSQSFVKMFDVWLPSPDEERILCSLKWGSGDSDIRWHYMRACALRNESWANLKIRGVIDDYIHWLAQTYAEKMNGEVNGLSMSTIQGTYKTNDELYRLYVGYEMAKAA